MNRLILGDNLDVMSRLPSETVDLIYLDPPFFSNRNYEVIWGDKGEVRSFQDHWEGGVNHYIAWLKERVREMHRLLKPAGSIFLHCDWHANAYIRVDILDKVFGEENFRSEIIWQRANAHNDAKKKLGVLKDTIFWYSKSADYTFNIIYIDTDPKYTDSFYRFDDNDGRGRYRLDNMASPNPRPNMMYEWKGYPCPVKGWRYEEKTMDKLDKEGRIYYPVDKAGKPDFSKRLALKRYLGESKGLPIGDLWTDIQNVQAVAKERIGYPTQKPEALMNRIIEMCSNEGDLVMDPFLGGGTTAVVAERLKRRWIGIDQSTIAIHVSDMRLTRATNLFSEPYSLELHKYDYENLLKDWDPFRFETWIIEQFGGTPNVKQRGDKGIDGVAKDGAPVQVKQSENIGRNPVDNFKSACERFDSDTFKERKSARKPVGYIIAFSFNKSAKEEVARLANKEDIIIELIEVGQIVPLSPRPDLRLEFEDLGLDKKSRRKLRFRATGTSEAGVEFYAWQWNHEKDKPFNPDVVIDKEGVQEHTFEPGLYRVAVRAFDNDGLEATEIIELRVNGDVQRTRPKGKSVKPAPAEDE